MAALSKDATKDGYRLSFWLDKRKKSIWLGGFTNRGAETAKSHVESLLASKAAGVATDLHAARWLGDISADIRARLAKTGLIESTAESRGPVTLGPFLQQYDSLRSDIKDSTHLQYRCAIRSLVGFFGADRRVDSISAADAESWRIHIRKNGSGRENDPGWSDNTTRRIAGRCRQFFAHAIKLKLIEENPFVGFSVAVHSNSKRQQFISRKVIQQVLNALNFGQ